MIDDLLTRLDSLRMVSGSPISGAKHVACMWVGEWLGQQPEYKDALPDFEVVEMLQRVAEQTAEEYIRRKLNDN